MSWFTEGNEQGHELSDTLRSIIEKYPPKGQTVEDVYENTKLAYRALIDVHPEIMPDFLFFQMYTPGKTAEQIANTILAMVNLPERRERGPRRRERGLSAQNKLLLDVDTLLHDYFDFGKRFAVKMDVEEFRSLLVVANKLRTNGESVDEWFNERSYPDSTKREVARALKSLYEVNILFREELYKAYKEKAKTVRKVPESGPYHRDSFRLNTPFKGGRAITKKSVDKDASAFREYLHLEDPAATPALGTENFMTGNDFGTSST